MSSATPIGLSLAGFDPSGGAGLLLDARVMADLGVLPMGIPLAETLQNGLGCTRIDPPGADPVRRLEALGPHLTGPWGVKVGLCALDGPTLRRLLATLGSLNPTCRIWDPILAPSAGVGHHLPEALQDMAKTILPGGDWVVAPNWGEGAALAGIPPAGIQAASPEALANPLLELGAAAVWLKGGHRNGPEVEDLWVTREGVRSLGAHPRLPGQRRGTGCFLSAAWVALRLKGLDAEGAARAAATHLRASWPQAAAPGGLGRPCFLPAAP